MEIIKLQHKSKYQAEIRELIHSRAYVILLIGIILIPAFAFLDFVVAKEYFQLFFVHRIICASFFALLILFNFFDKNQKYGLHLVTIGFLAVGLLISHMIIVLGGTTSGYYVGIMLVLTTYGAIFPLTLMQSSLMGSSLFLMYIFAVLGLNFSVENFTIIIANSFFFISCIFIVAVKSNADTNTRLREFNMRMQEKEYADKLAYYAENLEEEVDKRTKELEQSEVRFRELYDNIIDDVVLLDNDGNIVLANRQFSSRMALNNSEKQNIINFIHPDNRQNFQDKLKEAIRTGKNITVINFMMLAPDHKIINVECNAAIFGSGSDLANIQLLIRDVTARKRLEKELAESFARVQDARSAVILSLAKLSEYREFDPNNRLERFREYAKILAEELSLQDEYKGYISDTYIEDLYQSSILYDIGKVGISDKILRKKGRLTDEEREIINRHTIFGGDTIKSLESRTEGQTFLEMGKNIAYFHHERWDGQGYPQALIGDEIPLSARIVALADVYNALTSDVAYRKAYSHNEAVEIILKERGRQFAPEVLDAFVARQEDFRRTVLEMTGDMAHREVYA
jgi:PAS domain S-box-containing protein